MINDTNIDLVNDNVYTKFGLNWFFFFQDIEQKTSRYYLNYSVANFPKFELIKAFMYSLHARMKKIQFKMKALECSQDFSHHKSMQIFLFGQGQLPPQPLV